MKQEIATYLSTIKEDIYNLSKFLYENPEESFCENKAYNYIINILKEHDFKITEHFVNIPTAFYAEFGSGHPKIAYLCEYDAVKEGGHIAGHNLVASMSVAAGIALSRAIPKTGGTVIILGCPGEFVGGAKVTMAKQGVFNDIDVALMAHPDIINAENGTSMAILPICIKYKSSEGFTHRRVGAYSALDACLFTFNALSLLMKGFDEGCSIDGVIVKGGSAPYLLPSETESRFYIRAPKMKQAEEIEKKIKEFVKTTSSIMNLYSETLLYELPYEELIPNTCLSRIFAHNLKESGTIDIAGPKNTNSGLSLGNVSHCIPCIHPFINIAEDNSIKYPSPEFAMATISQYALDKVMKAAQALAFTGLDLIEKEDLLKEIKLDLNNNCKA